MCVCEMEFLLLVLLLLCLVVEKTWEVLVKMCGRVK